MGPFKQLALVLVSLTGLALLGFRSGAFGAARGFMDRFARHEPGQPTVSAAEQLEEEVQHRSLWGHHDHQQGDDARERFHQVMKKKMWAVRSCHKKCGASRACHEQCPKPWAKFEQKCKEYEPIANCHFKCRKGGGGLACHDTCPKPKCPWMARRMQAARACHAGCGRSNFMCHVGCPKPLLKLMHKCGRLEAVMKCHRKCGPGDCACHRQCPKLKHLWRWVAKAEHFRATAKPWASEADEKVYGAEEKVHELATKAEEKMHQATAKAEEKVHQAAAKAEEEMHQEKVHKLAAKAEEKMHQATAKAEEKVHQAASKAQKLAANVRSRLHGVFSAFV